MTDHPITPPPELVRQWATTNGTAYKDLFALCKSVATQAAQWGADQELEACCELLDNGEHAATYGCHNGNSLRAARRPKPPSLKELAMKALDEAVYMADDIPPEGISTDQADIIRRALESLPD